MYLVAPTVLRVAPEELSARTRARFGAELRRAGGFAQLCLLGAQACLDAAGPGESLGVLWSSGHGAAHAARAALADWLQSGEPVMPFTFIATQPHLTAALLAQRSHPIARSAFLYLGADAWPWLLRLAQAWLGECEQVLVGWVEESNAESNAEGAAHQSDWCVVRRRPAPVRCEVLRDGSDAVAASTADWISRLAAWHAAPRAALELRGGADAWRFAALA